MLLNSKCRTSDVPSEIRQMMAAAGGSKWDAVTTLTGVGEKTSFGLTGKFRMQVSLVTGSYQAGADYGLFANADGVDRVGRWRQDNSGQVHPLDSPEGQAVAVSESYLARHGYLFPQRLPANFLQVGPITEGTRRYVRIEVMPKQGRALVLWSDATNHLLDRAVMELSVGVETIRYGDYRPVEGLMLPFRISVERRDENETGTAVIRNYPLDGHPGWFGVDTGNNTDLIVSQHWAESNGLAPDYRNAAKVESSSVGGSVELRIARAKSFQIGGMDVGGVRILLAPGDAGSLSAGFEAGNFGNSILSHFTVTFDYHSEAMYLEPLSE